MTHDEANHIASNPDGIDASDLMAFWDYGKGVSPRTQAKHCLPQMQNKGRVRAFKDIVNYAANKATAMVCRQRGDITTAQTYELICERIYDALPTVAKW